MSYSGNVDIVKTLLELFSGAVTMTQYMITYIGAPADMSPEQRQQHMAEYKEWLASLGEAAVSLMNPLKNTQTIASDGSISKGGVSSMSGYTIIQTESEEAALTIAKACPFLDVGGSLEVSELIQMSG